MNLENEHIAYLALIAGFAIVAVSANRIAKEFQKIKLPLITGLIFTGILAGPYIIGLIPIEAKGKLNFINQTALAFIAFAAGSELYLKELRSRINSIKWNTFGQLVVTFVLGGIAVYFLADYIPYMRDLDSSSKIGISMITAVIFVARSPASAIAVINELRAKGPFVQTVMGVTVIKDFLVIILFSICLSLAHMLIGGQDFHFSELLIILLELALSLVLGFFVYGFILAFVLKAISNKILKVILILLVGFSAYFLSEIVGEYTTRIWHHKISFEPLLMCILASFYVTNYTKCRAEFLNLLEEMSSHVYVAFFTLTGATLSINVIGEVIGVALILFAIRMVTMILGAYTGGFLAKDPMKYNHVGWMPYITQAGVALGLATLIANEFPEWGNQFSTVIIALIVLNQFIGPPFFKWAIYRVGEDRSKAPTPEFDGIRDATIIGYEAQSVALARQLLEGGWDVQIATMEKEGSFDQPTDVKFSYVEKFSLEELKRIKTQDSEALVFMLPDKENLEICELAYRNFGTRDLIVRLNEHSNQAKFLELGAKVVDPSTAMISLLEHFVRSPQAASLLLGMEKGQDTRDIDLFNPDLHGITIRDLRFPSDVIILSVTRGGQSIITHGYTRLRLNDSITVVGSVKSLEEVQLKFDK